MLLTELEIKAGTAELPAQGDPRSQRSFAADAEGYGALANKVEAARSQ